MRGGPSRAQRLRTSVRVFDAEAPERGPWLTRDLSSSGFFLLAPGVWAKGARVSFIIDAGRERLPIRGRIVRVTAEGVAAEFLEASVGFQSAIAEILAERFAQGDPVVERRSEARWPVTLPALWRDHRGEHTALMRNASTSGAGFESAERPPVGDYVYVLLPTCKRPQSSTSVMGCRSRVVHHGGGGFGVEFVGPSAEFLDNIMRLLTQE